MSSERVTERHRKRWIQRERYQKEKSVKAKKLADVILRKYTQ